MSCNKGSVYSLIMSQTKRKPALMIQGTTSNAGKSILATAFCRIFTRRGFNVSPFKAQNMSLNSFVTFDNCEMGRAQAVQAHACRKQPDVRMNPVLLKPCSTTGSQVICMGKPLSSMNFSSYTKLKKDLEPLVHKAYDELADESDIMILEGAGSPAEINLKQDDIVNMAMAQYAGASVIICGDIDRGGVYAHFLGTMQCLDPCEQDLVKGFIVNRFRGDASLLAPAHDFILAKCGKPVLGVVPYINNIAIPDEDSVTFKSSLKNRTHNSDAPVTIALIDLPHISNATDIDPFYIEPDVNVVTAVSPDDLDNADIIIIPGSKNVINDLRYLDNLGFSDKIRKLHSERKAVISGICGGLQMLGRKIFDTYCIENENETEINAIGILDISTTLEREKTLSLTTAFDTESGTVCRGYEIHHGQTIAGESAVAVFYDSGNKPTGFKNSGGSVWGTYIHGIFDNDSFRRFFIDKARIARGLSPLISVQAQYDIEKAIEQLADSVENSVDMDFILKELGIK